MKNLGYEFGIEVAKGNIPNHSHINKFGRNTAIDSSTTEEIWDGSATYVFPATALMTSISQTADQELMRGATIEVQFLDANWDEVVQDAVLNGTNTTTVVILSTPLIRCYRMKVNANVVGDSPIRVHNTAENQDYAIISIGNNQTLVAVYMIPNGKTGYITNYWAHHNPATGQDPTSHPISLWCTDNENSFAARLQHLVGLPNGGGF